MRYSIGVDLGGTNIKAALVKDNKILDRSVLSTNLPKTVAEIEEKIGNLIFHLTKKNKIDIKDIENIGVGCPGIVDIKNKVVEYSCNFNWNNVKFLEKLENKLKVPIYIENDANTAAIGEYIYNNLKDIYSMVCLTLGTGLGAGIIINGSLYKGFNLAASEIGHMVIVKGGRRCNCGQYGCFERYASATAVVENSKEALKEHKDSVLNKVLEKRELEAKDVFDAARKNDMAAVKSIKSFVEDLSIGVSNIINILQPQTLIIGGGVSISGDFFLDDLKEMVEKRDYARNLKKRCNIIISKIGNDAGLIGAVNIDRFI